MWRKFRAQLRADRRQNGSVKCDAKPIVLLATYLVQKAFIDRPYFVQLLLLEGNSIDDWSVLYLLKRLEMVEVVPIMNFGHSTQRTKHFNNDSVKQNCPVVEMPENVRLFWIILQCATSFIRHTIYILIGTVFFSAQAGAAPELILRIIEQKWGE